MMRSSPSNTAGIKAIVILVVIFILGILAFSLVSQFSYFFVRVDQNEVGVQFRSGKIYDIVGPGVYSDFGLYVELKKVSSLGVPFSVRDEEIITADKQRIGLVVSGDAFRPTLARKDMLFTNWAQYSIIYLDDELLKTRVNDLTRQAMKVCVGERPFDDAIIGTARDELRSCVDDNLSKLADNYGLEIQNVTIPEVVLSPEVQAALDAIVQSRLSTEKAAQDKLKAEAEAAAEQAKQEGEIRVAQARIQEETRQQTTLAQLEQEKLLAQKAVIEAQKANDLLSAQQDLAINKALAAAAAEKAKVELATQTALAELYAKYPQYLTLQIALANASALKQTDKIIFTLEGMTPTLVLPGPGIVPTVETTPIPE
jgi:regulator of protease activity HflC (stomatin/prohibitin superfamily)